MDYSTRPEALHSAALTAEPVSPGAEPRHWLNLGVLAHVDAGKTSLTEALLHAGGAIASLGRVDDGTTRTDSLAVERRRGITVRSAVATFQVGNVAVNVLDTPGHPDFIAEVDRSLGVLDGAILVVSAVEGVQAQTIVLSRALRRLDVPHLIVVNKVDRRGADVDRVTAAVQRRLAGSVIPFGTVYGLGDADAAVAGLDLHSAAVREDLTARLAEHDDDLLAAWLDSGQPPTAVTLRMVLERLTRQCVVVPLLPVSARTGAGVSQVLDAVTTLLTPPPVSVESLSAQVFAVELAATGRICVTRMRSGKLTVRDHVELTESRSGTVTALEAHEPEGAVTSRQVVAGQIARVHGLGTARIGDWIGVTSRARSSSFPPPAMQTTVVASDPDRTTDLHRALSELADIDPLIQVRPGRHNGGLRISVYGQVQQEVIAELLAADYGLEVEFSATGVVCIERPARTGSAVRRLGDPGHLHGYTLGAQVEPTAPGSGVQVSVTADRLTVPLHVYSTMEGYASAIRGYLDEPLAAGPHGWAVTDVQVTVIESGYPPAGPAPADVRHTTAEVVAEALRRAGTVVCEPVDRFRLEVPDETSSAVLNLIARHRGVPTAPATADGITVLTGSIPTVEVDSVRAGLPSVAHGEAVLETELENYRPIRT